MTLDGVISLVEPDTVNQPIRRVRGFAASPDSRAMPIDVEESEVRATIDATFALAAGDDEREGRQPQR